MVEDVHVVEVMLNSSQFEMRLKEIFKSLLEKKEKKWTECKTSAVGRMNELAQYGARASDASAKSSLTTEANNRASKTRQQPIDANAGRQRTPSCAPLDFDPKEPALADKRPGCAD